MTPTRKDAVKVLIMVSHVPALGILLDLLFGILMWASCAQFMLTIFVNEDSKIMLLSIIRKTTAGGLFIVRYIAPSLLVNKVMPLYLAFVLFILRFYALPAILGYDVVSFSAMPLEALIKGVFVDFGLI